MDVYSMVLFKDNLSPELRASVEYNFNDLTWPITLHIKEINNAGIARDPGICIHTTERGLINFANSIQAAKEKYLRERKRRQAAKGG